MKDSINIKSLSNEDLEIFISKYGEVIKTKSFYTGWDKKKYHLSLQDLLRVYGAEFDYTDNGKFRQKISEETGNPEDIILTRYQRLWFDYLSQYNPTYFITIKLPRSNKNGLIRTRDHELAKKLYRQILREFEYYFVGSNRWKKPGCALPFKGVMECCEKGFYHIHLFIIDWEPTWKERIYDNIVTQLNMAAAAVIKKHDFCNTVFKIQRVYYKPGLLAYMLKNLKETTAEREKSYIFDLKTWFNIDWEQYVNKTPKIKQIYTTGFGTPIYTSVKETTFKLYEIIFSWLSVWFVIMKHPNIIKGKVLNKAKWVTLKMIRYTIIHE